ncbi:hypothetical protein [Actinoplanes sp. NPDC020271]|uniref:hypothetical protein n=1 Tax=Actinoplanes sp. NPDC020271 TaxID=3363896 RepID=UPI00379D63A5
MDRLVPAPVKPYPPRGDAQERTGPPAHSDKAPPDRQTPRTVTVPEQRRAPTVHNTRSHDSPDPDSEEPGDERTGLSPETAGGSAAKDQAHKDAPKTTIPARARGWFGTAADPSASTPDRIGDGAQRSTPAPGRLGGEPGMAARGRLGDEPEPSMAARGRLGDEPDETSDTMTAGLDSLIEAMNSPEADKQPSRDSIPAGRPAARPTGRASVPRHRHSEANVGRAGNLTPGQRHRTVCNDPFKNHLHRRRDQH